MPALEQAVLSPRSETLRARFCELTGYSPKAILAANYETGEFLTRNGGRYKLIGDKILHLGGPSPDPEDRL